MRNILINGDFQIWQRGTEFQPRERHLQYTADRWNVDWWPWKAGAFNPADPNAATLLGEAKISRQPFPLGQTEVPGGPKYYLRWEQQTASSPWTMGRDLSQQVEDVTTFAGHEVTLSCYLRADRPATVRLITEQWFGPNCSPPVYAGTKHPLPSLNVTTSWQRYSVSTVLESVAGKVIDPEDNSLNFIVSQSTTQWNVPGGSAAEPLTLDIANCQMELGSAATEFERRTFADQLAAAERYFQKSYSYDHAPGTPKAWASSVNSRQVSIYNVASVHLRKGMRRPPQVILFNPATGAVGSWRSIAVDVNVSAGDIGTNYFHVDASNGINAEPIAGHWIADAEYRWSEWW